MEPPSSSSSEKLDRHRLASDHHAPPHPRGAPARSETPRLARPRSPQQLTAAQRHAPGKQRLDLECSECSPCGGATRQNNSSAVRCVFESLCKLGLHTVARPFDRYLDDLPHNWFSVNLFTRSIGPQVLSAPSWAALPRSLTRDTSSAASTVPFCCTCVRQSSRARTAYRMLLPVA